MLPKAQDFMWMLVAGVLVVASLRFKTVHNVLLGKTFISAY